MNPTHSDSYVKGRWEGSAKREASDGKSLTVGNSDVTAVSGSWLDMKKKTFTFDRDCKAGDSA